MDITIRLISAFNHQRIQVLSCILWIRASQALFAQICAFTITLPPFFTQVLNIECKNDLLLYNGPLIVFNFAAHPTHPHPTATKSQFGAPFKYFLSCF